MEIESEQVLLIFESTMCAIIHFCTKGWKKPDMGKSIWYLSCGIMLILSYDVDHVVWCRSCGMTLIMWYDVDHVVWCWTCRMMLILWSEIDPVYDISYDIWFSSCDMVFVMWYDIDHVVWFLEMFATLVGSVACSVAIFSGCIFMTKPRTTGENKQLDSDSEAELS